MPYFCSCGSGEYICKKCGKVYCSDPKCPNGSLPHWNTKITGNEHAGTVCNVCFEMYFADYQKIKNYKQLALAVRQPWAQDYVIWFGKYKGTLLKNISKEYIKYIEKQLNEERYNEIAEEGI